MIPNVKAKFVRNLGRVKANLAEIHLQIHGLGVGFRLDDSQHILIQE
jgi:hypothetical protein